MDSVTAGAETEAPGLFQMMSHLGQKHIGRVMLGAEEQYWKVWADLLKLRADGELLVVGKCRAHNGEVIAAGGSSSHRLVNLDHQVGGVASLGQEVRSRAQLETSHPMARIR